MLVAVVMCGGSARPPHIVFVDASLPVVRHLGRKTILASEEAAAIRGRESPPLARTLRGSNKTSKTASFSRVSGVLLEPLRSQFGPAPPGRAAGPSLASYAREGLGSCRCRASDSPRSAAKP